jgi:NADH-quinone oxidoreductase subunit M
MIRAFLCVAALLLALLPRSVRADGTASFAESGPVVLDDSGLARVTLRNTGSAPLHVTSLYARTTERDPRIPGTLIATFEGGGTKIDLTPGSSAPITLRWDRQGARMNQLFAHVVVESSDLDQPQRAIGVVGRAASPVGFLVHHVGTWLVLLPLLAALAIAPLRFTRRVDEKIARFIALGAVGLCGALVVWAARNFDALAGRVDGNEGLQFVERARLFGSVEWYLGIDGASLTLLLTVVAMGIVGVVASFSIERRHEAYFASYLLYFACVVGAVLAVDAMLLVLFIAGSVIAALLLCGRFGAPRSALRAFFFGAAAVVALVLVTLALHRGGDATLLVDGTRARSFALPELARGEWLDRTHNGLLFFGKPFVKGAFVAVFVAGAILLSAAPLHGAVAELMAEAPTGAAIVVLAAGQTLGTLVLLRFGVSVLPEGVRWASPAIAGIGAASVVWGALAAFGETDLRRVIARASVAHGGIILLGIAAATPEGMAGAIAHTTSRALIVAMALVGAGVLHDRVRVTGIDRFGGLSGAMPRFGVFASIGLLAAVAVPGSVSFVSAVLAIGGALPGHRVAAAIAALGLALLCIAQAIVHRRLLFGELDERWQRSAELEPFGGRFPDLDRRELALLLALAIVVIGLGLSPRPLLQLSRAAVTDLDARVNIDRVALVVRSRMRIAARATSHERFGSQCASPVEACARPATIARG